ncbi:MAG: glycoside hydrolase family 2 protein [Sedimentisphaeraceae bacterium JB056]
MALIKRDLAQLDWTLTGYIPFEWQLGGCREVGAAAKPDIETIPAKVPGSVQKALLDCNIIPDWNIGDNARCCEWVENRHWLYETKLPAQWFDTGAGYCLKASGLDHKGQIYLNGNSIFEFENCHLVNTVDITPFLKSDDNLLQILFECPPKWLGQFYCSSKVRDWKPRFYYTWDWTSRLVQIGIWDDISIEQIPQASINDVFIQTDYDAESKSGSLSVTADIDSNDEFDLQFKLYNQDLVVFDKVVSLEQFRTEEFTIEGLDVLPWQPNGKGDSNLYKLEIHLLNQSCDIIDSVIRSVGFKTVEWRSCLDAPSIADPWICNINGEDVFLQGVNWTPIRPNYADVDECEYRKRLELYKSLGLNILRVWGGYTREKQCFYDICDELGILVWQDMPLSSSGIENYPPDDDAIVNQYTEITNTYIQQLHHHASILLWCGGNELTTKEGIPLGLEHPMFRNADELIKGKDPQRRFVPASPSGPSFLAEKERFGTASHWEVHGPWKVDGALDSGWENYWDKDDSLFRSETGAPGSSDAKLIRKYSGNLDVMPSETNSLWRRTGWWLELEQYIKEKGEKPKTLEDYIKWSQKRQSDILCKAVASCKKRFPRCGGIILWMGHDSFPCTANTSIVDFEGNPKPAALTLKEIYKS